MKQFLLRTVRDGADSPLLEELVSFTGSHEMYRKIGFLTLAPKAEGLKKEDGNTI